MKGFEGLIEAAANSAAVQARRDQQLINARRGQVNKVQRILDGLYQKSGAELAPALRPFWNEYVEGVDQQIQAMTLRDNTPLTSVAQGQNLLREGESFHEYLKNYDHFDGKLAAKDEIDLIEDLILDPTARRNFIKNAPVDKSYAKFSNAEQANEQLEAMQNYANIGFIGADMSMIEDGSYTSGGYRQYGEIDYSGPTPRLKLLKPNGIPSASGGMAQSGVYLDGISIYGANHQALYSTERFATEREAKTLFNLGAEYLMPEVKSKRENLSWSRGRAEELVGGLIRDTTKKGQEIRYSMLTQERINNSNYFSENEELAFVMNNPLLAFDTDENNEIVATPDQINSLRAKFDSVLNNDDYVTTIINGSKYDRAIRQDTREDRAGDAFNDMLAGMTMQNPNDVFEYEEIERRISEGEIFQGFDGDLKEEDIYHLAYARLFAQSQALLGSLGPGTKITDLVAISGPSFSMTSIRPDEQAGVTRQLLDGFSTTESFLPQTLGRFPVNSGGGTDTQFSPQTNVEGNIDTVYFLEDPLTGEIQIAVALNKSGVTGQIVGSQGKPITPLEGRISFDLNSPIFRIATDPDGSNRFEEYGGGILQEGSQLLDRQYETGTPELVFKFNPQKEADQSTLTTLAGKLDLLYGKTGERYPNAVFDGRNNTPDLGYVLNAMFDKANQ
jgi:hypothetical protein